VAIEAGGIGVSGTQVTIAPKSSLMNLRGTTNLSYREANQNINLTHIDCIF